MTKTLKTINVEVEDWNYLKRQNINISAEIREFLSRMVNTFKADDGSINEELEQKNLQKNRKILAKTQAEIRKSEEIVEKFKNIREEKQEKRMKKEKELAEKMKKCTNCGGVFEGKFHKFPRGNVCLGCFMNADAEQIRKWNEEDVKNN